LLSPASSSTASNALNLLTTVRTTFGPLC
jgi:hypothetical protein